MLLDLQIAQHADMILARRIKSAAARAVHSTACTVLTAMEQQRKHARCYVYLRVSSLGQVDGHGFERRLVAVRSYAQANGVKIAEIVREEGVSGTKDLETVPRYRNC